MSAQPKILTAKSSQIYSVLILKFLPGSYCPDSYNKEKHTKKIKPTPQKRSITSKQTVTSWKNPQISIFFRAANGSTDQRLIKFIILLPGQGWEHLEHPLPQSQHDAEPHLEIFAGQECKEGFKKKKNPDVLFVLGKKKEK